MNCERCGKPVKPRTDRTPRFCSIACANKSRQKRVPKPCEKCGTVFIPPRNHPRQRFCSLICRDAARTTAVEVLCRECGTPITRKANRIARFGDGFCSRSCISAWRTKHGPRGESHVQHVPPVKRICEMCRADVSRLPSHVKQHTFCSRECREEWQRTSGYMSGPNSPAWRGGYSDYRGPNWLRQRRAALERDAHRCCSCGTTKRLQVHHLRPFVTFDSSEEANHLTNLQTLCLACHKAAEWAYWRAHPEIIHLYPDTSRIHVCRKCQQRYLALSPRSLDCDGCCDPVRLRRRKREVPASRTPLLAPLQLGLPEVAAS